jgi:hypothetical protein
MSDTMELAREHIKPLMRKEAIGPKKIGPTFTRVKDFFTSTAPEARGSAKLELAIPTAVGAAEAGRGEYYRRKGNTEQSALLDTAKKDLINDKLNWTEKDFQDLSSGVKNPRTAHLQKVLSQRGYTGEEKFSAAKQGLRSALIGASASPKYTRAVMQQPGSKAMKHAKDTMSDSALHAWKKANVPEPMVRAGIGLGSTALLHQGDKVAPAIGGVLEGAATLSESGEKLRDALTSIEELTAKSKDKGGSALDSLSDMAENLKDATSGETIKNTVTEGAKGVASGIVTGVKGELTKVRKWAEANPGLAVAGGAGTVGLFAAYKIWTDRAKRKRKEEEAQILAKALKAR